MVPILEVKTMKKSFKKHEALKNISFSMNKGEVLGIVGPNGAGKSTTIRSILGIIYPDHGQILFEGKPVKHIPRDRLGYLPEERGLYRNVRVMDVLLYLAKLKNYPVDQAKERALLYLDKLGLNGVEKKKIEELSKGMAQKVQFISSIIHEPSFLVLDEPFSGLDPVSQDIFKEEIHQLKKSGTSILLSSHQMNLVEEICDRLFLMNKGERLLYGTIDEIKATYSDFKCTIKGKNEASLFAHLDGVREVKQNDDQTTLYLHKDANPLQMIQQFPSSVHIQELHIDRISLHDIFVGIAKGGLEHEE